MDRLVVHIKRLYIVLASRNRYIQLLRDEGVKIGEDCSIKKTVQWYLEHRAWWEHIISGDYQNYYHDMYGQKEVLEYSRA